MNAPSISQSIRRDSAWSAISFLLIVVSGLLLNAGLAQGFGRSGLGLFNTCLSVVLILGQLGSLGINAAVAFQVPSSKSIGDVYQPILRAAFFNTFCASSTVTFLFVLAVEIFISNDSSGYVTGLRFVYGAVFLLPFNKVLVAYLNGLGEVKSAAIGNALRFVLLLFYLIIGIFVGVSWKYVPIIISLSEFSLLLVLLWKTRSSFCFPRESKSQRKSRQKSIISFGLRSIPAVFLLDLNTRIDVLFLSLMKTADVVGQYTIASTLSEGLFQMAMATRLMIDPRIAGLTASGKRVELSRLIKRHIGVTYLAMTPVVLLSILLYSRFVNVLFSKENASGSWEVYVFLALGVLLASGFIPLTNFLNQVGDPTGQSLLLVCLTSVNILGNVFLIPQLGASGAALATAFSQLMFVPLLIVFVKSRSGMKLGWTLG